jgi:BD-FAE protein
MEPGAKRHPRVISVAGPYELNTLSWGNLWTPVTGNVEEARRIASPMTHVSATTKPTLIIQSDDDKSVPVQQAVDMVAKLLSPTRSSRKRARSSPRWSPRSNRDSDRRVNRGPLSFTSFERRC